MSIRIDLEVFEKGDMAAIDKIIDAVERLDQAMDKAAGTMAGVSSGARGAAAAFRASRAGGGPGYGGGPGAPPVTGEPDWGGDDSYDHHVRSWMFQQPGYLRDYNRYKRNQARENAREEARAAKEAERAAKEAARDPLMEAIGTSRMSFSGGKFHMMPLVNRLVGVLSDPEKFGASVGNMFGAKAGGMAANVAGMVSGLGPMGIIGAQIAWNALTDAVGMARDAAERTAESMRTLALMMAVAGGSAHAAAVSGAIGRAAGVSDMAAVATSFQGRLSAGGAATGYAAALGINPVGGPFGDTNYTAKLNAYLRKVLTTGSDDEARRMALAGGLEQFLYLRAANPADRAALFDRTPSPAPGVASARAGVDVGMARLSTSFDRFAEAVASPVFDTFGKGLNALADALPFVNPYFGNPGAAEAGAKSAIYGLPVVGQIAMGVDLWSNLTRMIQNQTDATDRNTKAQEDNTRIIKENREVFGTGPRAGQAYGSGWRFGAGQDEALRKQRLGAY